MPHCRLTPFKGPRYVRQRGACFDHLLQNIAIQPSLGRMLIASNGLEAMLTRPNS